MIRQAWVVAIAAMAASCAAPGGQAPQVQAKAEPKPIPEIRPGYLAGYMQMGSAPNSLAIIPGPPTAGSPSQARDDASAKAAVALNGSPRWSVAVQDAELKFPAAAETFSCALGVKVSPETTPRLYTMLRRTLVDTGLSTYPTKTKFQRPRPFMVNNTPMCTPQDDAELRKDGSYPSGHSAIGWGWALILAEAAPDRATEVLHRGRAFTQSRVVCNVHWLSDTEEGRMMGAATVAKLHDNADFKADMEAAKAEIIAARAAGHLPTRDCAAETAALTNG